MNPEEKNKSVDAPTFGSTYQKQAQEIARDLTDPAKKIIQEKTEHDPFPARSSKRSAIKTYKDYAAESMSKGGGSLTKMIIAEREKKQAARRKSPTNPKNILITVLSGAFVLLGLGLVAGAFFLAKNIQEKNSTQTPLAPQPLILYDYRNELYISNPNRTKLIRKIEQEIEETSIEVGSLKYVYFAHDNQHDAKALMETQDLLEDIQAKISGTLSRSFGDNFMYGIYSTTENAPFLIVTVDHFSVAYAEILAWESSMGLDLGPLLGVGNNDFARTSFVDVVYYNKDARAVLDSHGEPILGYSFVDKNTVVFFSNKLALKEVVNRMQKNTVKR